MKTKKILFSTIATLSLVALTAGMTACNNTKPGYFGVDAQADIFTELNSMTADVGILDYTMASYLISQDTALTRNISIVDSIELETEQYGIAFRKNSTGLCDKVNSALNALKNTKVAEIANKYGLSDNVLSLDYTAPTAPLDNSDWDYIVQKGTFVVGYTLNPPMAIKDGDNLIGFDIDLPKAIVEYLNQTYNVNLEIKFQLISWSLKETELSGNTIDCIWNGMTIRDEYIGQMEISIPYLLNRQCVIARKADLDKYSTIDSLKSARVVAERNSAGETIGKKLFD